MDDSRSVCGRELLPHDARADSAAHLTARLRRGFAGLVAIGVGFLASVAAPGQLTAVTAAGVAPASPQAYRSVLARPRLASLRAATLAAPRGGGHPPLSRPALSRSHKSSTGAPLAAASSVLAPTSGASRPLARASVGMSPNPVPLTGFVGAGSQSDVAAFGSDQAVWPPDTQVAAGGSDLVEAVNDALWIYSKTGTQLAVADLNTFFAIGNAFSFSDPRVVYDAATSRWFLSGFAFDSSNDSIVLLATSRTSDPAGYWYTNFVSNNRGVVTDQPKVGIDSDVVVMSWNDFSGSQPTFSGQETWVLQKSDLVAGSPVTVTAFAPDVNRYALVPAQSLTATSTEYLVYNDSCGPNTSGSCTTGTSTLGLVAIMGTPAGNNVTWTETDPTIAATTAPPNADQPGAGGSASVATNDDRFLSATSLGGVLYVTGNDGCVPGGDSVVRPCARLIDVTVGASPAIASDSVLGYGGGGLYFPAAAPDPSGDVFIAATFSSMSVYPEAVGLTLAAGASSFSGSRFQAGSSPNTSGRWGDYSGAAVDPSDPTHVWVAAEYAPASSSGDDWGTAVAELTLPTSTTTTVQGTPSPSLVGQSVTQTATVSPTPDGGTVAFSDNGSNMAGCDAAVVNTATGMATCTTGFGAPGGHAIVARYSGDTNYAGGAGSRIQQVNPRTTTYVLDGWGGLHPYGGAPAVSGNAYWAGWDIARGIAPDPCAGQSGGYVLDGYGGVHPFGGAPAVSATAYWPGWDIARGIAATCVNGRPGGYVLDGYGGAHPFGGAPAVSISAYWPGWDIARGIVLRPTGPGGYVLDGFGGVHPFGGAPAVSITAYWSGWDIARGIVLQSTGPGGYVLDGFGGVHPFGGAAAVSITAYWPGWKIARGLVLNSGPGGYVLDGLGGLHPFGGAPAVAVSGYWSWDIARGASF
jgi:Bacterial Ig-like domain (group 3)